MEHGASLDLRNINDHTALDIASGLGQPELSQVFLTHRQAQTKLREAIAQKAQEKKKEEKEEKCRLVERAEYAALLEEAFLVKLEAEIKEEYEKREEKKEKNKKKRGGKKSERDKKQVESNGVIASEMDTLSA